VIIKAPIQKSEKKQRAIMNEELEIAQEIAKAAEKGFDLAKRVDDHFVRLFGSAEIGVGGMIADWIKYYRYKNWLRIQDKVKNIHKKRKLEGKPIPILSSRLAIPLLENASEESDDTLQNMWAGLIANATDPEKKLDLKRVYIRIISELEPIDAQLLKFMWENPRATSHLQATEEDKNGINIEFLRQKLTFELKEIVLPLQNLARLGCVMDEYSHTWDDLGSSSFGKRVADPKTFFRLSPLGYQLIFACT
jgi:hypothetical protein